MKFKKILIGLIALCSFSLSSCSLFDGISGIIENKQNYSIKLDSEEINLNLIGQNAYYPQATVYLNNKVVDLAVSYSISNTSVARIDSGNKVSGVIKGSTYLVATLDKDSSVVTKCPINVISATPTYTSISVNKSSFAVDILKSPYVEVSYTIKGDNYPNQNAGFSCNPTGAVTEASTNKIGVKKFKVLQEGTISISIYAKQKTSVKTYITITATDSTPASISLNETEINLAAGRSKQLIANIAHSTETEINWSGSKNGITVDSNGLVSVAKTASIGSTATIVASLKNDSSVSASCAVTVIEAPEFDYDYTIMIYMCASTLEQDGREKVGLFTEDIKEILSIKNIPDSFKIIIETGGTTQWNMTQTYLDGATSISSSKLQRWEVVSNKLKLVETLSTNYMASESSFQSFLEWGLNNYNAEQMGVIISGHGGGIAGCAYDDNYAYSYYGQSYQNCLDTKEVAAACKNALQKHERDKFTWIGYDCCVMQCADIASINADYFDYMVASQESEYGSGWNHDVYMPLIVNDTHCSPETVLPKICSSFVAENHSSSESSACLQTLSVIDLKKVNTFVTEFNNYVEGLNVTSSNKNKVITAFQNSYNKFGEKVYGLCDFSSLLTKLDDQFSSDSTSVKNSLTNMVISNSYCSKYSTKPCGVNAFFPKSLDSQYSLQVGQNDYTGSDATKLSAWQSICLSYGSWDW